MSTPTYPYRHALTNKVANMTEAAVSAFPDGLLIRVPQSSTDPYFTGQAERNTGSVTEPATSPAVTDDEPTETSVELIEEPAKKPGKAVK